MSRIAIVEEEVAQGTVKEIYEQLKSQMGMVPNVFKSLSTWPELFEATARLFGAVMQAESKLPRATKEMIAVLVSELNRCPYCVSHHVDFMKQYGVPEPVAQQIAGDYKKAELDEKTLKLLEYAEKVSRNAYKVTDRDFETLRTLGWSDREILEATAVVAQFNFMNRMVDALGVELEAVS